MENITTDVHELEKGMEAVRKEAEIRGKGVQSLVLRDFLANSEEKLKKLKNDARIAQDAFRECVEYFAESPRTTDANSFFCLLVRFTKAFKVFNMPFFYVDILQVVFRFRLLMQRTSRGEGWNWPRRMPTIKMRKMWRRGTRLIKRSSRML